MANDLQLQRDILFAFFQFFLILSVFLALVEPKNSR